MPADWTFDPGLVFDDETLQPSTNTEGVLLDVAGGTEQAVYDLLGTAISTLVTNQKGYVGRFKADIPVGVMSFGSVLQPVVAFEAINSGSEAIASAAQAVLSANAAALAALDAGDAEAAALASLAAATAAQAAAVAAQAAAAAYAQSAYGLSIIGFDEDDVPFFDIAGVPGGGMILLDTDLVPYVTESA